MIKMRKASDPRFTGDLRTAAVRHLPVTITYITDDGRTVVRTIEPYGEWIKTQAGNHLIKAMDRESGKPRSWRVDRVQAYTLHKGGRRVLVAPQPPSPLPVVPEPRTLLNDREADDWAAWFELTYDPDADPTDRLEDKDI